MTTFRHPLPFGAELRDTATRFRLWAPSARDVKLCLTGRSPLPMPRDADGFAECVVEGVGAGDRYRFSIDDELEVPDPASRWQPEGVHGPSEVLDPCAYRWQSASWRGRPWHEAVIYELHVGTFSPEGSYAGVIERLDILAELGITAIELMPLGQTPGRRNWGYDGVQPFAPCASYGQPHDLKRLIDEAHRRGMMVLLDVIYNHFGPEGNYLHRYAAPLFTDAFHTPWGAAIDMDGPRRHIVRRFFIENALYWLEEYLFDGLRFDAVHAIPCASAPTFLEELCAEVRQRVAGRVHLVLENDNNRSSLLERAPSGEALCYEAQWNDDFHHAVHVLTTGERDGYYGDYADPLAQLGRGLAEGFIYQGDASAHRGGRPRGEPSAQLPPSAFVNFIQNHDQVGNRAFGQRLSALCGPEAYEAAFTVALLAPSVPLLFMGEEWAATTPFLFFCDFEDGLREAVREGRRGEFACFDAFSDPEARERIPDPGEPSTMLASRLRWDERDRDPHRRTWERYRELLRIRQQEITPRLPHAQSGTYRASATRLSVHWELGDTTLGIELNVGDTVEVSSPPRVLAKTSNVDGAALPRWGVLWWLAPREGVDS